MLSQLGIRPYTEVWEAMRAYTEQRGPDSGDQLWLVEHPPTYTLGQAGRRAHIHAVGDIPVQQSDRGGQVTYHGPGQAIVYTLLDLPRLGIGVKTLVATLEQAVIDTLADYRIDAQLRTGAPGVYVGDAKIASLGLRVRRGCSYHGVALNVAMDLEPFSRIDPCGYPGLSVTQLTDLARIDAPDPCRHVGLQLAQILQRRFRRKAA